MDENNEVAGYGVRGTMIDSNSCRRLAQLLYQAHVTLREVADILERRPMPGLDVIDMGIRETNMSVRARAICRTAGVSTLRELSKKTEAEMRQVRNCGDRTIIEFRKILKEHGLDMDRVTDRNT